ncbi:hypothetical protein KX816_02155 [Sphingosinicellaceae bacterium]|nr:hypothetical protein KX816_02155 [Sphingosinicellaceae bacterium]
MFRSALLSLLMLAACAAGPRGDWPSLALRPGEVQPLVARPAAAGAVGGASSAPAAAMPNDTVRDAATRQASLERDVAAFEKRLRAQLADTAAANGKTGTEAEADVELEQTRLDRLGGQAGDLRDRFDELAGDLARQAAAGTDVSAALARVGVWIDKVEALKAEQAKAYAVRAGIKR